MQRGSVLVDISIDQGGCSETSKPTTHADPTYVVHDVVHYCVTNMPGAAARTSTFALNTATLPFILALADKGPEVAMHDDPPLRDIGLGLGALGAVARPLRPAEQPVPAQIDAVPALVAQFVEVAAEAHVHDLLVAHLLHEIHRRHEVAVLRHDEGDVVDVEGGVADQVGRYLRIEHLLRRDRDAAGREVARKQLVL